MAFYCAFSLLYAALIIQRERWGIKHLNKWNWFGTEKPGSLEKAETSPALSLSVARTSSSVCAGYSLKLAMEAKSESRSVTPKVAVLSFFFFPSCGIAGSIMRLVLTRLCPSGSKDFVLVTFSTSEVLFQRGSVDLVNSASASSISVGSWSDSDWK